MDLTISRLKITSLLLVATLFIVSCAKDEPLPEEPDDDPVPAVPPYFAWQVDGSQTFVADSAFCYAQSHVIFAFKNTGEDIEVNLSSTSTGTYTLSSATGNMFTYTDGNGSHNATGTFIISSTASNRLTGHFNANFTGSNLSTITGTFSEIPKR